jgi:hypothetical protein
MNVPAKTNFSTTALGVRPRELIIIGAAGFLGLALLALPLGSIFLRILIAAGISSAGLTYALWKVQNVWTIEEYFFHRLRYSRRARRFLKGGAAAAGLNMHADPGIEAPLSGVAPSVEDNLAGQPVMDRPAKPLFWLPAALSPQSNRELLGLVGAWFAVTVFLGWMLASGGIEDIQIHLRLLWSVLWKG